MERLFNKVLYEIGDKVQSKWKDNRIQGAIEKEKVITDGDGLQYQIIWVAGSFFSAYDFEPSNPTERKAYYAEYAKHGMKAKRVVNTPKPKSKVKSINIKGFKK